VKGEVGASVVVRVESLMGGLVVGGALLVGSSLVGGGTYMDGR
jgi:hypothetical protein